MRFLKRWWSAMTQKGTGGLVQPGDWRCRYPDGYVTRYMSYGDAKNLKSIFGGRLEWRFDK